jgi:1-acyl-sn-glycerol-3-phosphate acyltransferase
VSERVSYPVPWDLVFGLTGHIRRGTRRDLNDFTAQVVARMQPPPLVEGLEHLPDDPRFVLAANHYQRKGLWILHPASVLTQAVVARYGPLDPPLRWLVTANWPRWRFGPFSFRSPGDLLLPRVAHALWAYPVSFFGANPAFTARSLRLLLRELPGLECPIGIFPEGVAGTAGKIGPALPGIDRLLRRIGRPVVPALIGEHGGRLVVRLAPPEPPEIDVMGVIRSMAEAGQSGA